MTKILIIDDEQAIRKALKEILEYEKYEVEEAKSGFEGLEKIRNEKFDLVLCDIKMPQMDGIEVLEKIMEFNPDIPVVMITGHGSVETAVEALKKGAYDFIEKPLDMNRLLVSVRNAGEKKELVKETKTLRRKIKKTYEIVGESIEIHKIKDIIDRVAPTEARVLITGENGTGKELVARWMHEKSPRTENPFVEVNCAAIPSELIESELFGHEKGAFTSAHKKREGKFEQANTGTIFLDEIGDMSLAAQAKVLRVLEESKILPVGSNKLVKVDVRVIAATNKNLKEEIKNGNFREDLYHRLSVIIVKMPTLRERKEDIPLLIEHFTKMIANEYNMAVKNYTPEAINELKSLKWTGNIREFRNVIERLMILCEDTVQAEDVRKYALPIE
ncbi:MAG: sigma-54-dependent Fis family transcriptional regulator [Bacteroidales bacterium]|nr:sigma-54-dependent Fis family transcriptional regulator [Bacteroidales bacterium]